MTLALVQDKPTETQQRGWLQRHRSGDETAFRQLITTYQGLVYTFLRRYGVAAEHRDDLFQEVFLRIHQSAARYRSTQPLRPWLITIVLNTVRNHQRSQRRFWRLHQASEVDQAAAQAQPEEQTDTTATLAWLEQQIAQLAQRQREILTLYTLQNMRIADIAQSLNLPPNTVKTHLRRARLKLAQALAERRAQETQNEPSM